MCDAAHVPNRINVRIEEVIKKREKYSVITYSLAIASYCIHMFERSRSKREEVKKKESATHIEWSKKKRKTKIASQNERPRKLFNALLSTFLLRVVAFIFGWTVHFFRCCHHYFSCDRFIYSLFSGQITFIVICVVFSLSLVIDFI